MSKKIAISVQDEGEVFYRNDFKPAVDRAGDTVGGVFTNFMKNYVVQQELVQSELDVIELFVGEKSKYLISGENIKFIGKEIGRGIIEETETRGAAQILYKTKKNKFLLYSEKYIEDHSESKYKIFDKASDLMTEDLFRGVGEALLETKVSTKFLDI